MYMVLRWLRPNLPDRVALTLAGAFFVLMLVTVWLPPIFRITRDHYRLAKRLEKLAERVHAGEQVRASEYRW
jgi:hypothetical protein